jgi:hypothetical protein
MRAMSAGVIVSPTGCAYLSHETPDDRSVSATCDAALAVKDGSHPRLMVSRLRVVDVFTRMKEPDADSRNFRVLAV